MKKRVLRIGALVVFILIVLAIVISMMGNNTNVTGQITTSSDKYNCLENDDGLDFYNKSETNVSYYSQFNKEWISKSKSDSCFNDNFVIEYYCISNGWYAKEFARCENGCEEGACKRR